MFIKEIELNNFRIYKGSNKINLSPDNDRNIVIVSGKNGFGKTTFLMSLVWCLYGKQMSKVDDLYRKEIDEKGGYGKYIGKSLNRLAETENDFRFFVSAVFRNVKVPADITCSEVKITRSFDTKTGGSDKLEILIDGEQRQELIQDLSIDNQSGEEIFIRDFILPLEIAKFFFFDAEKIVSLAEENNIEQRQILSKAYSEVLGIHKYQELKEQLENIQDDYRKGAAKPEEKKEFFDIEAAIKKKEVEISELEKEIENLKDERADKKYQSDRIQEKLIRDKDCMTVEQLEQLRIEESQLDIKINEAQKELKELFDLIPFALMSESLLAIDSQVKSELNYNSISFKKEEIENKTKTILEDLENARAKQPVSFDIKIRDFYEAEIRNLIKRHFYNNLPELPNDFQKLHDFSENQSRQLSEMISNLKHSFKDKLSKIHTDYSQSKSKIQGIQRRLRDAEKNAENSYIKGLRAEKESLDMRLVVINSSIENSQRAIGSLSNEIKSLKQKQADLRKKMDVSDKNKPKDEKLEELIKIIKSFTLQFKEEKKKSLEKSIKENLTILMHKKDFIKRVEVDILGEDDIDINLYDKRDNKIDKSSLSMGERQMYASALLNALVNESDIDFPVFIDSPMQKFDKDHAENIIKNFYPNVSSQVIIFPLIHKELTESEYNLLKKNMSQAYIIKNIDHDQSEFLKVDSENLITEYNKLYDLSN